MINIREAAEGLRHYLDALDIDPAARRRSNAMPLRSRPWPANTV